MTGIYRITNTADGKIYIGQSINISHRWSCHEYDLKNNRHKNSHLQRAYNKNPNAFVFDVICCCEEECLNELEKFYINKYKSNDPSCGYNFESGGNSKGKASDETRKKLSLAKIGNQAMKGKKLSEEWKKHLSEAQPHRKKIVCIDNGETYESFADAARKTGLNRTKIVSCCTGKRKQTGGLRFKYYEQE